MGASNKSSGHILKYMVVIELILSAQRIQILRSFTHSYSYFEKAKKQKLCSVLLLLCVVREQFCDIDFVCVFFILQFDFKVFILFSCAHIF